MAQMLYEQTPGHAAEAMLLGANDTIAKMTGGKLHLEESEPEDDLRRGIDFWLVDTKGHRVPFDLTTAIDPEVLARKKANARRGGVPVVCISRGDLEELFDNGYRPLKVKEVLTSILGQMAAFKSSQTAMV